jgi:pimeloyl-ACP methyl ester carboxylesterase
LPPGRAKLAIIPICNAPEPVAITIGTVLVSRQNACAERTGAPRTELWERMQALIDAGQPEQALLVFCRDVLRLPPPELASFQESPGWSARVAVAHTIPRELQAVDAYTFDPKHFHIMRAPTLLLVGGDSPPFRRTVAEAFHAALPNSQIGVLPGQRHGAVEAAPDLFANETMRFLTRETLG